MTSQIPTSAPIDRLPSLDSSSPLDLLGSWTLEREIDDRAAGLERHVSGTATVEQIAPDTLRWSEQGTMTWPGHEVPVSRGLLVVGAADGWMVRFDDGRAFHPWSVGEGVEHLCGRDRYRGLVRRPAADLWTVEWRVVGPAKDYTMTTAHHRERSAP